MKNLELNQNVLAIYDRLSGDQMMAYNNFLLYNSAYLNFLLAQGEEKFNEVLARVCALEKLNDANKISWGVYVYFIQNLRTYENKTLTDVLADALQKQHELDTLSGDVRKTVKPLLHSVSAH